MNINSNSKKRRELFSESSNKLLQTTVRFKSSTFSEIEDLEKQTGKAKAFVIRRLVQKGLESVRES